MEGRSKDKGKIPNVNDRRLAQVRALKALHFAEELSIEEQLEAKDARITLLEERVAELERRLSPPPQQAFGATEQRPARPQPETSGPTTAQRDIGLRSVPPPATPDAAREDAEDDDDGERRFNFYRD